MTQLVENVGGMTVKTRPLSAVNALSSIRAAIPALPGGMGAAPSAADLHPERTQPQRTPSRLPRWAIMVRRYSPFASIHLAIISIFFVQFSWGLLWATAFTYAFLMVGMSGWMHRYFSHRTFRTSRAFQFIMAFWAGCAAQRGTLWWAAHHRRHHAFAETVDDPHSPIMLSFWRSHMAWIFEDAHQPSNYKWVRDLARYPELRFLDTWYWTPPIVFWSCFALFGAWWGGHNGMGAWSGAVAMMAWGPVLGTILAYHATFCINSVTHLWGTRRYDTGDDSRNVSWLSYINFGEGWHNNHHYYPHSANLGFHWWQFDPTYYLILLAEKVGLVWDVKKAPLRAVEGQVRRAKPRPEHPEVVESN